MNEAIKVGDKFILDIKRLGINGEGIGFYNKKAVFVKDAIPGEGHNVEVTNVQSKAITAKSFELKHYENNLRVVPECPHYNECGGCQTMHINYEKALEFKRDILIEALNRYTKLNTRSFEIKKMIGSQEKGYRNRSQLQVVKNEAGSSVAMTKESSNIAVSIDSCFVQNDLINYLNKKICELIDKLEIPVFTYKGNKGVIRYITIRVNKEKEALVTLVCYDESDKIKDLAIEISKLEGVKSVYKSSNRSLDSGVEIVGEDITHLVGDKYIIESLGKIKYQIYPNTFFQLNTEIANKMYEQVLKSCKLSFKERVLDLYCGVGSISLYLAHNAKEVVGIEYNKNSILAANENAKLNKINNAKFYQGNAHELMPKMIKDGEVFDIVVVDPPRTGLDDKLISALLKSEIKKIIYVSCNPATLAKNIELLSEKYQVNSITPFDMFPQTAHTESITVLTRK